MSGVRGLRFAVVTLVAQWFILVVVSLLILEGCGMGSFSPIVLFSPVHGQVLKDGKPVVGAKLVQKAVWASDDSKNPVQHVITNADGRFAFSAITRKAGLRRINLAQPMIIQTIMIHYQGAEYIAWKHGKNSYDLNSELEGRPLDLRCELTRQPDYEGTHFGICTVP